MHVVELTTIFYILQNSDHIQEHLSADIKKSIKIEQQTEEVLAHIATVDTSDKKKKERFAQYEAQLSQLIKFIFFENRQG